MIGTTVKMDPHEKWMFAIATDAMNMNFICWHETCWIKITTCKNLFLKIRRGKACLTIRSPSWSRNYERVYKTTITVISRVSGSVWALIKLLEENVSYMLRYPSEHRFRGATCSGHPLSWYPLPLSASFRSIRNSLLKAPLGVLCSQ